MIAAVATHAAMAAVVAAGLWWGMLRQPQYRPAGRPARLDPGMSWQVIPLAAAVMTVMAMWAPHELLVATAVFVGGGAVLSWTDIDALKIPNKILLVWAPLVTVAVIGAAAAAGDLAMLGRAVAAATALMGFGIVMRLVARSGMGDAKLFAVGGLVTGAAGWETVWWFFVWSHLAAVLVALGVMVSIRGRRFPKGPCIVLGLLIAIAT